MRKFISKNDMVKLGTVVAIASGLVSCATLAEATLENRLSAIGLSGDTAACMATDLNQNLSQEDVIDLTRYTFNIARTDSAVGIIRELMNIDNPRAVTAVGSAGLSCVQSGLLKSIILGS